MNFNTRKKLFIIYQWRYTIFLFSFLLMLFGDLLTPISKGDLSEFFLLFQSVLISTLLFVKRPKMEKVLIIIIIIMALVSRFHEFFINEHYSFVFPLVFFSYFILVSSRIYMDLLHQKQVNLDMISAVFCGFILMGVLGAIVFISVDDTKDAFTGMATRDFANYVYFSFVTLLTIGYGDISPITDVSRRLVVLFGLIGNFYTVFVTAIIIGKYQGENNHYKLSAIYQRKKKK